MRTVGAVRGFRASVALRCPSAPRLHPGTRSRVAVTALWKASSAAKAATAAAAAAAAASLAVLGEETGPNTSSCRGANRLDTNPTLADQMMVAGTLYGGGLMLVAAAATIWQPARPLLRNDWIFAPLCLLYGYALVNSWEPDTLSLIMPGDLKEGLQGKSPFRSSRLARIGSPSLILSGAPHCTTNEGPVLRFQPPVLPQDRGNFGAVCPHQDQRIDLAPHPRHQRIRGKVRPKPVYRALVRLPFPIRASVSWNRHVALESVRLGVPGLHSVMLCAVFGPLGVLSHTATAGIKEAAARRRDLAQA